MLHTSDTMPPPRSAAPRAGRRGSLSVMMGALSAGTKVAVARPAKKREWLRIFARMSMFLVGINDLGISVWVLWLCLEHHEHADTRWLPRDYYTAEPFSLAARSIAWAYAFHGFVRLAASYHMTRAYLHLIIVSALLETAQAYSEKYITTGDTSVTCIGQRTCGIPIVAVVLVLLVSAHLMFTPGEGASDAAAATNEGDALRVPGGPPQRVLRDDRSTPNEAVHPKYGLPRKDQLRTESASFPGRSPRSERRGSLSGEFKMV